MTMADRCGVLAVAMLALLTIGVEGKLTPLRAKHHKRSISGALKGMSVGPSGVWGVNRHDNIYYRTGTFEDPSSAGTGWQHTNGPLKQVDVGTNVVWGVNTNDNIYFRVGITPAKPHGDSWRQVSGGLKHVSVSPMGHVWGVNRNNNIYVRLGASNENVEGNSWSQVSGALKQISSGNAGVWGVNDNNQIYYRIGTFGDTGLTGPRWQQVDDDNIRMSYISSGDGFVLGLTTDNKLYIRQGMSFLHPTGTNWRKVPTDMSLTIVDIYDRHFWGVDASDNIFYRKLYNPSFCL